MRPSAKREQTSGQMQRGETTMPVDSMVNLEMCLQLAGKLPKQATRSERAGRHS